MRYLPSIITAVIFALPVMAEDLASGYRQIGNFTGSIGNENYSLISVSHDADENSDMGHAFGFGMHQYTIALKNGLDEYQTGKYPLLEITVQPDPMGSDEQKKNLRIDSVDLYISGNMIFPDYSAQLQSGFGTTEVENMQTDADGSISFDFTAELPKVALVNYEIQPVDGAETIRIKGHFDGKVPAWEFSSQ